MKLRSAIAFFLCAVIAFSLFGTTVCGAEEAPQKVTVKIAGALSEAETVDLYQYGTDYYIDDQTASPLTGFTIQKTTPDGVTFRNAYRVWAPDRTVNYDLKQYRLFRLDNLMKALQTGVFDENGTIVFLPQRAVMDDLGNLAYEVFFGSTQNAYYVDDDLGFSGGMAKVGAATYNIVSSVGFSEALSYISGGHSAGQYDNIFCGLIEGDKAEWIGMVQTGRKLQKNITQVIKDELEESGGETFESLRTHAQKWGMESEGEAVAIGAMNIGEAINLLADPAGSIIKKILEDDTAPIKDLTGKSFTVSGLDFFTWLSIYTYINDIAACTASDFKMLSYSFYKDGKQDKNLIPDHAASSIGDIYKMYQSKEYSEAQTIMFRDLLQNAAHQTIEKTVGNAVIYQIMGSNAYTAIFALSQTALKMLYDWTLNASAKMDYVEQAAMIRHLQDSLRCRMLELAGIYAYDTAHFDPLSMKYVTMLYLRLAKLNAENLAKASKSTPGTSLFDNALKQLYEMNDADLTDGFYVERIPVKGNTPVVEQTTDCLTYYIGKSFDEVEKHFGASDWKGEGEDGYFINYTVDNTILMFSACDYGESVVNSIYVIPHFTAPAMKVTDTLSSDMNESQIRASLPGYTFKLEKSSFDNGVDRGNETYLQADSADLMFQFHWSSVDMNQNNTANRPGTICIYSAKIKSMYRMD